MNAAKTSKKLEEAEKLLNYKLEFANTPEQDYQLLENRIAAESPILSCIYNRFLTKM